MKFEHLQGSIVAMITPFHGDGSVNFDVLTDVSRLEIEADTRSVDRARRSYCMKYTGQTYGYAGNYDLTVNTGSLGFDKATELVCSAAEMI